MFSKLHNKFKPHHLRTIYENVEDIRISRIILKTIFGLIAAFLMVICLAYFSGDMTLSIIILVSGFILPIPIFLLFRGHLRLSSIVLLLIVVVMMTLSASQGQGIHDIAIMSYPVAIFFANLVLERRDFFWVSFSILIAMCFLGFGEVFGWFIPNPNLAPVVVDFIIAVVILLLAIIIADSLAENIRKNMQLAKKEIAIRKEAQEQLRHLNSHDELTGIYNRAFFDEVLTLMERSREYPVSIIFADIDNLKEVNDQHGHAVGDELLKSTAKMLGASFRDGDILARVGGDEFAVILPQTKSTTANNIVLRLRIILAEHNSRNPDLPINVSMGTSTTKKGELKKALITADQRMYGDKEIRKLKR